MIPAEAVHEVGRSLSRGSGWSVRWAPAKDVGLSLGHFSVGGVSPGASWSSTLQQFGAVRFLSNTDAGFESGYRVDINNGTVDDIRGPDLRYDRHIVVRREDTMDTVQDRLGPPDYFEPWETGLDALWYKRYQVIVWMDGDGFVDHCCVTSETDFYESPGQAVTPGEPLSKER